MICQAISKGIKEAFLALLCLFPVAAWAQQDSLISHSKIVLGVSANAYRGDLGDPYDKWTAAYHVSFLFNHQHRLHGGLHISTGSFTGQAIAYNTPDLNLPNTSNQFFKTSFVSFHYALQYDIIQKDFLVVYVSQGIGLLRFQPQDQFDESLQDQQDTRASNETYTNVAALLPTQFGIDYYFPNHFGVGVKAGWLNTTTDYLDNVAMLGKKEGNDNVLQFQFLFYIPAAF